GSNTTEAHPIIGLKMKEAVRKRGAKLIIADPRKIELTRWATVHIRQRPGTDVALLNSIMHVIVEEGLEDKEFIKERTSGFEELKETIQKYTPEYAESITGVPAKQIREAARLYAQAKSAAIFYTMGITQHITGTDNVKAVADLALITGNLGRPGTGVNPLRGQNNVQGACDMGCLPNVYPGYQAVNNEEVNFKMVNAWGRNLSKKPGLTVMEMVEAIDRGEVKALYIMGENPMLSDPDLGHLKEVLKKLEFFVVQDIFLTETAQLADIVLPAVSYAEKDGTFTNTERRVQLVRKAIPSPGEAKPDWQIISDISTRMGYPMGYSHPSEIMKEIASVTPIYGGISYERLENGGLQWPCTSDDDPGVPILHTTGAKNIIPVEYMPAAENVDDIYPFILTTGRMLFHFHTGTMTRNSGLDDICGEPYIEISDKDASRLDIEDGQMVKAVSRRGEIKLKTIISKRVSQGVVFIPFHFHEAAANVLTNTARDPVSKIPEYKVCAINIEKIK
ncbi:MAG: molybdopterin oxidoreductase family protein, partial [bacterium]